MTPEEKKALRERLAARTKAEMETETFSSGLRRMRERALRK